MNCSGTAGDRRHATVSAGQRRMCGSMASPLLPVHFQKQESPPRPEPGGLGVQRSVWDLRNYGRARRYLLMRYVLSPPSRLKDSTAYPAFFIAPAMNPRTVCRCQPIVFMISEMVAPPFRRSMATTWAVRSEERRVGTEWALAAFLPFGAALAAVAFLVALALAGGPGRGPARALAARPSPPRL